MSRVLNRLAVFLVIQAAGVLLAACSSSDAEPQNPPPPPPVTDTTPPSVPTAVNAAPQSPTSVLVSWNASTDSGAGATGVAGYRVYRDGNPVAIGSSATLTYTDNTAIANTTYSYSVAAYDAATPANVSLQSGAVSATTPPAPVADTTPPTVPVLSVVSVTLTQVTLSWTTSVDPSGIGGYRIYRNGGATPIQTQLGTTYTDNGRAPNTTYTYTVIAFDAAVPSNPSADSNSVSATTLNDTTAPTVPTNVNAAPLSDTSISVTWTPSTDASGISGYRVSRGGVQVAVVTSPAFTDTGLTAATTYSYTVIAVDNANPVNVSAASAAATATTNATPPPPDVTPPTVPANVTAVAQSTTSILVSWTASTDSSGIAGYRVFRGGTQVGTPAGTSFTDTGLTERTTYSYTVQAVDGAVPANVSAASAPVSGTTRDGTPPTVPTNVTAVAQSSATILVSWSASTDAGGIAGYRVFRDGGATAITTVTTLNFTDTGLGEHTTHSYTIRAVDNATPTANVSNVSASASATTFDITPPTVPGGVTATALSSSSIRVDWTASTDAGGTGVAGYRIFRNGSASVLATVTGATTYTNSGLTASTAYSYTVRAFDAATPANVSGLSTAANATTQAAQNPSSGLDARPGNTSCVAGAPPSQSAAYTDQHVYTTQSFADPIAIMQAPGDNSRWFVVQQGGIVKKFNNVASPPAATNFVNVTSLVTSGGERGLLGMAFHPNFPTDPRVYLYYTTNTVDRVSEFRTLDGGATLDPTSEFVLFNVTDPEDNHNGGNIAFGPDGMLYIGIGDGGGGNDQHGTTGNGQRLTILLGKMLRIDVGSTPGQPYTIPASNPFAGGARCNVNGTGAANCPEIYAFGFRNPWRWSFDRGTGDLWVGDVGEGDYEEIDKVTLGGNYGWRCREGNHSTGMSCGSSPGPMINPVAEVPHPSAFAITGGYVYRGSAIPGLNGRYVFGDYSLGFMWDIARDTAPTLSLTDADGLGTPAQISSFGEDQAGELYFLDYANGWVYKVVPSGGGGGGTIAGLLSQTGCANAANPTLPASGMIPYAPNAPFWSDGAVKTRWLALPNGTNINVDAVSNDFDLPNGSVLRKDFTLGGVLAETRLFMRHTDGNWAGYTYQWNPMGTDATRVIGGLTTTINGQTWEFPSESACLVCHTAAAGRSLGLEIGQLNGDLLYPATGRTANQVFTLNFIDLLRPVETLPVDQRPVIPNPFGSAGTEGERARAWLHSNCSNCHRPSGGTSVNLDFRYTTTLLGTNACEVVPVISNLGIANARLIAAGDASRSVVVERVNRVGTDAMPPLARHSIDTQGVALLTSWINSLANCN